MSGGEILLIFLAILVLFGADKMPGMARTIGKGMREFQKAADDIKSELANSTSEIRSEMNNLRSDIQENVAKTRDAMTNAGSDIHTMLNNPAQGIPNNNVPGAQPRNSGEDKSKPGEKFNDIGANI